MALTKVSGDILDSGIAVAGIVTATGFDGPFVGGSDGINAGIVTATGLDINGNGDISGNLVVGGNLTANGDFTTLNTTLREVELLRVDANSSAAAGIITQRGSGDIFSVYDTSTEVFKIADGGTVGIGSATPLSAMALDVVGSIRYSTAMRGATGSSSTPSYAFYADHDTGMYRGNGINILSFATAGEERVTILANGNVGIGSVIPTQLLDVGGTIKTTNITSNSSNLSIENTADRVMIKSANRIDIADNFIRFQNRAQNATLLEAVAGASGYVKLFHNDSLTASVTQDALTVTGRTSNSGMIEIASNQGANNNDRFRIHKTSADQRLSIQNYASGSWVENMRINAGGSVELKHSNGSTVLETKGYGIDITGGFITTGGSIVNDGGNIKFGTHSDLQIFHDNSNNINVIQCHNGRTLHIDKDNGSENMAKFIPDGAVELYHGMGGSTGSSKKLETTTDGVTVTGSVRATGVNFPVGSTHLTFGHGGSFGELDNLTGNLRIKSGSINLANRYGNHNFIYCNASNSVDLYYDAANHSTPKLKTSATGITVDGEVAASQDYPNFRPTVDFNFAAEKKLDPRITYERTGPASFVNEFGKVVKVGDNAPRFDHDPTTRECKGLLIEETRTNVAEVSEDFDNTTHWEKYSQSVVTNVATAPDGTLTADNIIPASGSSAARYLYFSNNEFPLATSTAYTTSIFVKKNGLRYFAFQAHDNGSGSGHRAGFDLDNGTVVTSNNMGSATGHSASIVEFPNGWFRCILTGTTAGSGSIGRTAFSFSSALDGNASVGAITADGSNGGYVWGHQVEAGAFATSYIPTDLSTATRGDDIVRIMDDDFTDIFGTEFENFSVVADFDNSNSFDSVNASILEWWSDNNNYYDRIQIMKDNSSPYHIETRAFGNNAGIFSNGNLSASSKAATNRLATSWSVDYSTSNAANRRWAFSFSGEEVDVVSDNTGTTVPALTRFGIGCSPYKLDLTRGVLLFKRLMVYNQTLSDNQLRTLSAQ